MPATTTSSSRVISASAATIHVPSSPNAAANSAGSAVIDAAATASAFSSAAGCSVTSSFGSSAASSEPHAANVPNVPISKALTNNGLNFMGVSSSNMIAFFYRFIIS